MKISIAERLHPFSHRPGTTCPLPLSTWQATIYPTRVILQKIDDSSASVTLDLDVQGPFQEFTVELDLEKGVIRIFGRAKLGFLRYEISRVSEGILLKFDKLLNSKLICVQDETVHTLAEKGTLLITVPPEGVSVVIPKTRLSLGMHKAQDWDLVLRRFDLKEMLPVLMRLGSMIPYKAVSYKPQGTLALFNTFQRAYMAHNKLEAYIACEQWLRASFTGVLVPTLADLLFQGIIPLEEVSNQSPLVHLLEGAQAILSLFFQETERHWDILPCLLPPFDSGRLINVITHTQETLSLEWSKHQLQKFIIQAHHTRTQYLKLPKEIRSFRVRTTIREKGKVIHVDKGCAQLELQEGKQLFLDRFQK